MSEYSIANTTKEQRIALIKSWQPEDESFDDIALFCVDGDYQLLLRQGGKNAR